MMCAVNQVPFPQLSPFVSQYFTNVFYGVECLLPDELVYVESSAAKRRADFSTGRYCARQALAGLINASPPILQGSSRQPLWPHGVVGSISHSQNITGAVAALNSNIIAIGLDIETIGGIKPDMWNMVFHQEEQELIQSKQGKTEVWATLLFSLKEAFYKMQYPLTKLFLDFLDVSISEINGRLCLRVKKNDINLQPIVLDNVSVVWTLMNSELLSVCYISAK